MLEQSQAEFKLQYTPHRAIDQGYGDPAFLHTFNQRSHVSRFVRDIQIDACAERKSSCLLLRGDDPLVDESSKSVALADNDSLKSQLLPQDIVHPLLRAVGRNVFNIGITGHYSERAVFGDGRYPRREYVATQGAL